MEALIQVWVSREIETIDTTGMRVLSEIVFQILDMGEGGLSQELIRANRHLEI